MVRSIIITVWVWLLLSASVAGESEAFKKFDNDYGTLGEDLLRSNGEVAQISDFVYTKDVATFTFEEGLLHMARYVDGRPTTAIFVGKGSARIDIPVDVERRNLEAVSGKAHVDEQFEVCLIRFADDLDLKLKEQFTFETKAVDWRTHNSAKQEQSEFFFKPSIYNTYDNYFQLLRSHYERADDGYFFIDFNRYTFAFDPNRPEEVIVGYEFEGGDVLITEAAVFQRQERNHYGHSQLSDIPYDLTTVSKHGIIDIGGIDGLRVQNAQGDIALRVNADSLKYLSLFLAYNLKLDSVYYNGNPVDYKRRKDLKFIGVILPDYAYQGDTVNLSLWYRGKDFDYILPYVDDPKPAPHSFEFITPGGYNYLMPGMGPVEEIDGGQQRFTVAPGSPYRRFFFEGYVTGYDTVAAEGSGLAINFIKSKNMKKQNFECFIPDEAYETAARDAVYYFQRQLGNPPGVFLINVFPEQSFLSMPGLMVLPQNACVTEGTMSAVGGFDCYAGYAAARQWFGNTMRPQSHREAWVDDAVASYLGSVFVQNSAEDPSAFYSNMLNRRDTLFQFKQTNERRPLGIGDRAPRALRANRGAWMMHMLRFLMLDLETRSDKAFFRFLHEMLFTFNNKLYNVNDFVAIAEKHSGQPLDWFFDYWLYDYRRPDIEVRYAFEEDGDTWAVKADVKTKNVGDAFRMPMIFRVELEDGKSVFRRGEIAGTECQLTFDGLPSKPRELHSNEYYGVLCDLDSSMK